MKFGSVKFTLNGYDLWAVTRGGLIILLSIILSGVIAFVADHYLTWNYVVCAAEGMCMDLRLILIPVISSALDLGRRWLTDLSTWRSAQ